MLIYYYDEETNTIQEDVFCVLNLEAFEREMYESYEYWSYDKSDFFELVAGVGFEPTTFGL